MKKYILLSTIVLFSYRAETPVEDLFKEPINVVTKLFPIQTPDPVLVLAPAIPIKTIGSRAPAQIQLSKTRPRMLSHLVEKDPNIETSTGEWIASNITALPLGNYDPSFGKEIYRDKNYAYFTGKTEESLPVAFNPVDQRFHPLSQIILLKKINEELRREIVDEGHKEYYYNQRMGFLSIKSTSQDLLSLYSEFKNRGLDVGLEVLKETSRPR